MDVAMLKELCAVIVSMQLMFSIKAREGPTESIVFFIDGTLRHRKPTQMNEMLLHINDTLENDTNVEVTTIPIKEIDAFVIFRAWNNYQIFQLETTSYKMAFLLLCHRCARLEMILQNQSFFCQLICFDDETDHWSTCDSYSQKMTAYITLVKQLFGENGSLIVFSDHSREQTLLPVLNEVVSYRKTMWLDNSTINCISNLYKLQECKVSFQDLTNYKHYFVSASSQVTETIVKQFSERKMIGQEYKWLVERSTKRNHNSIKLQNSTASENLVIITHMHSFNMTELLNNCVSNTARTNSMQEQTIFHIERCKDGCASLSNIGRVTSNGRITNKSNIFDEEFGGFDGKMFNIVTKTYFPFVKRHTDNGTQKYSGLVVEILDALSSTLNFRYNLYEVPDGQFGIGENGSWTGMIGVVHRKEADMAASGITISAARDTVVDFTFPFWEEPSAVLLRRTMDGMTLFLENILWIYKPLTYPVWISFILSFCLISWILCKYTKVHVNIFNIDDKLRKPLHASWYIVGAFLQQGGYHRPKSASGKFVSSSWLLVIIIVYGIYTGNLIAVLSVKKLTMPFDTLEQMVAQSEFTYGAEAGIIHLMLFKNAKSGIYSDIWRGIESKSDSIVPDGETGLQKVKQDKYALIGDKTYLQANSVEDCDISLISEEFYKVGFGFAVQEGWPYKKYLDIGILKLLKGGFIERWKQKHWPKDKCGIKLKYLQSKSISISSLSGNFVFLATGIIISSLALLCETNLPSLNEIKKTIKGNQNIMYK